MELLKGKHVQYCATPILSPVGGSYIFSLLETPEVLNKFRKYRGLTCFLLVLISTLLPQQSWADVTLSALEKPWTDLTGESLRLGLRCISRSTC